MSQARGLLLACAAWLAGGPARSMPPGVEALALEGQSRLYNLEFDRADEAFERLRREHPGHPAGPFLLGAAAWWKARYTFTPPDEASSRLVARRLNEAVDLAQGLLADPATRCEGQFFTGGALGLLAHWELLRGNYLAAALEARESVHVLRRLAACPAYAAEADYGLGLYGYEASRLPASMRWVTKFVIGGYDKRAAALARLDRAAREARYVRTDAQSVLTYIYVAYDLDPDRALANADRLLRERPDSPIAHTMHLEALAAAARFDELLSEAGRDLDRARLLDSPFAAEAATYRYFQGLAHMGHRRAEDALAAFNDVLRMNGRSVWLASARVRRGCVLDALGRRAAARTDYQAVVKRDDPWHQGERAKRYLKRPFRWEDLAGDLSPRGSSR